MKVLYITDPGIVGGATRSLVDIVSAMRNKGVEGVVCTSTLNELNDELTALGVENFASGHRSAMDTPAYKRWKKPFKKVVKGLDYYVSLPWVLKKIEASIDLKTIDIIHTNSARNDIGCILAKKYNIPHIMHIREFGREDFECIYYRHNYEKYISRYTTKFIAISQAVKKAWVSRGIDEDKVTVIYNGVDNIQIEEADTKKILQKRTINMVIVGGVCEAKGQLQAVEALGYLNGKVSATLDIIGWGDSTYIELIKNRASELGIADKVHILGPKSNIGSLLKNYDVGLTCSRAEGFGRVTAEYMHARLGIIVSNTGANEELIYDGENGLVYKYGDKVDLSKCILRFFTDRNCLVDMAEKAQAEARSKYTKEINASSLYKIYRLVYRR